MFSNKNQYLSMAMWLLATAFFAYQFVLRLWPSLMMQSIMQQFEIDATAFGVLASSYYYGYAGMQIPMALLLERFGARAVMSASAVVCGVSMLIFSHTDSWAVALATRFLIGCSSAVGFLGTSKVITEYFRKENYAQMVGYTFSLGLLGAVYGGKPVTLLVNQWGSLAVASVLSFTALGLGLLIFVCLKGPRESRLSKTEPLEQITWSSCKALLANPYIWFLGVANLLMVGSLEGFADVWGVNYLIEAYGFAKADAAEWVSFIFIGMLVGGPLLAFLSKKWGSFAIIAICGFAMAGALSSLFLSESFRNMMGPWSLRAFFAFIGILCCYQVIVFTAGRDFVKPHLFGVTTAFLNGINMLGGSFFHTLIGIGMDAMWDGALCDNLRVYDLNVYNSALLLIPLCAAVGGGIVYYLATKRERRRIA